MKPGITFHALKNLKKCEIMNPHIHKWAPTLGVRVPMDSQISRERFQGVKTHGIEKFFIPWEKILRFRCFKWARMTHLDT